MTYRDRSLDPHRDVLDEAARRAGYRSASDLERAVTRNRRRDAPVRLRTSVTLGPWYRLDVGLSGDTTYLMAFGSPSGSSTWAMVQNAIYLPARGRVTGGIIQLSADCTQGTADLGVRIVDPDGVTTADYLFDDAEVSTDIGPPSKQRRNGVALPWEVGIDFEEGAQIAPLITTSGTFAPTSARATAWITIVYKDL